MDLGPAVLDPQTTRQALDGASDLFSGEFHGRSCKRCSVRCLATFGHLSKRGEANPSGLRSDGHRLGLRLGLTPGPASRTKT